MAKPLKLASLFITLAQTAEGGSLRHREPVLLRLVGKLCSTVTLLGLLGSGDMALGAGGGAAQFLKQPAAWFASDEAKRIAGNVLSYQADLGGWPKNTDTVKAPFTGERKGLKPTFDNSATTDELRFLERMFNATKDDLYRTAFSRGLDYILKAQYPNGGWPQFFPPGTNYHRHITFNDNAMVRLLEFQREIYTADHYAFVAASHRQAARAAFARGIACILQCQIKVDGKLTAWCAQHDEQDFSPRTARAYELRSFSGSESAGITRLLMSLDHPTPEIARAVEGAVAWFESVKLTGIRIDTQPDVKARKGTNKVVVRDATAPPLWARFYDLPSQQPLFVDRDGIPKANLADIGDERRNGYAWYGNWPLRLLEVEYPAWKKQWGGVSSR